MDGMTEPRAGARNRPSGQRGMKMSTDMTDSKVEIVKGWTVAIKILEGMKVWMVGDEETRGRKGVTAEMRKGEGWATTWICGKSDFLIELTGAEVGETLIKAETSGQIGGGPIGIGTIKGECKEGGMRGRKEDRDTMTGGEDRTLDDRKTLGGKTLMMTGGRKRVGDGGMVPGWEETGMQGE